MIYRRVYARVYIISKECVCWGGMCHGFAGCGGVLLGYEESENGRPEDEALRAEIGFLSNHILKIAPPLKKKTTNKKLSVDLCHVTKIERLPNH